MKGATTPIDEDYCWDLLATGSFGRVSLSVHAMPMIVPVRYTVGHRMVRIEPPDDAGLGDALQENVVAFEADGFDVDAQQAWSVHAVGRVTAHEPTGFDVRPSVVEGRWLTFF